ncbi:hypothetical protein DPMN_141460 [Dreissena polymorpha]|uniref:B box-type domain-containing protein n=1 Tax=Dreissena polymorpha TaxID=45954 RepID=A0A9D4GA08_DREPO|nr:hypothetical protein DPMN_141460 [Dreissena polymorpha]
MAACESDESTNSSDMPGECVVIQSCEPCVRNNSSTTATVFCKICNELFCDQCNHLHKIFKPGKHDVVGIEDIDSVPVKVDMKGIDICHEHDEKIRFYCEDHAKLCCSSCVLTHRQCDKFHDLVSLSVQKGQELHDLNERLLQISFDVNAYTVNCKQSETELNESIASSLKEVDEIKDRLVHLVQDAKQKLLTEANRIQSEEFTKFRESHAVSAKVTEEINKLVSFCKLLIEHGTNQQQYIAAKHLEVTVQRMETDFNQQQNAHQECTVKLAVPKELTSLIAKEKDMLNINVLRNHKLAGKTRVFIKKLQRIYDHLRIVSMHYRRLTYTIYYILLYNTIQYIYIYVRLVHVNIIKTSYVSMISGTMLLNHGSKHTFIHLTRTSTF